MAKLPPSHQLRLEVERTYTDAKAALNTEAQENWSKPEWHREQAALIAERPEWGFQNDNIVSSYFPSQSVGPFEKIVIEDVRNGQIDESQTVRRPRRGRLVRGG